MRCWCPEARLYDKKNRYRDQYQAWERTGFLEATDGNAIDYDYVRQQIVDDVMNFDFDSIAIDRLFNGHAFGMALNQDLAGTERHPRVFGCGMGYYGMAEPCLKLEKMLLNQQLNHRGNPVLRFMADSVAVSKDPAGNSKPNKDKSQGKIDGIVSTLFALDRYSRLPDQSDLILPIVA